MVHACSNSFTGSGRRAFLAIELAFNRVFGEKLNPFYYLGAISYFMFWVVVASGFYIYVFYETGVDTTFASVERLTHTQWFAGGVMRSLHRYASDAMVLTMLLHLARHFFFDRYRGFRAFSWITGVILIWLVYVSGRQRLHAAVGPARAVRGGDDRRMVRRAAGVPRHHGAQLRVA